MIETLKTLISLVVRLHNIHFWDDKPADAFVAKARGTSVFTVVLSDHVHTYHVFTTPYMGMEEETGAPTCSVTYHI